MNKIPFDAYDFFGYLASGLLLIVGMDRILGFPHVLGADLKIVDSAVLVLAVYMSGQLVAGPAKTVLEDVLVGKILRRPNRNLFRAKRPLVGSLFFPGFYTPLPEPIRSRVLDRAAREGVADRGEALFLHVRYASATLANDKLMAKLDSFLNKYGMARNLAFTSLLIGVAMAVKHWISPDAELRRYTTVAVVAGVLLFYRYLKFFRQYSFELFNTYSGKP